MIDARNVDLPALAGALVDLKPAGKYLVGACPFCGGRDRFTLKPGKTGGWVWFCRSCGDGKYRSPVDFVMRRDGLTFREACARLGGKPVARAGAGSGSISRRDSGDTVQPSKPSVFDDGKLQTTWRDVVDRCARRLWEPEGKRAREYLNRRGLTDETMRAWGLGYSAGQNISGLWVERGIVIPCEERGRLAYVKIRRQDDKPKYRKLAGGGAGLFGAHTCAGKRHIFLTEGEFDTLLLWQEAGDLAGVGTLGSAGEAFDLARWGYAIGAARSVMVCYDRDAAGLAGAVKLAALLPGVMQAVSLPEGTGKDITDFWKGGGDLRAFVAGALDAPEPVSLKPAPVREPVKEPSYPPIPTRLPLEALAADSMAAYGLTFSHAVSELGQPARWMFTNADGGKVVFQAIAADVD